MDEFFVPDPHWIGGPDQDFTIPTSDFWEDEKDDQ
jgi:hypothetical protein